MIKVKENIYWIGVKDWALKRFHGHELSTHRGSTYNSYLIKDEKTVLVDTVWDPYKEMFLQKLEAGPGLDNIDMIIINHMEPDHGGSLGHILSKIPDTPIYCSKNGADTIKKHFHKDWNFNIVKTGDRIKTGKYELLFIEMKMLHWPDSMMVYVEGTNTVLSNDAFGQHFCPQSIFNDEVDNCELYQEAIKYYANILSPFNMLVKKKIDEVKAMKLPIDIIAPSHGVIWRDNPMQIVDKYYQWSQNYSEDFISIVYDTMYNATQDMAKAIGKGLSNKGEKYKLFNCSVSDQSDLITELFRSKGIIVGSCTVNNTVLRSIAAILSEIKSHKFKNKPGAAFGSYGWSGEAPKVIKNQLEEAGLKVLQEPVSVKYRPTGEELALCTQLGEEFAVSLQEF